MKKKKGYLMIRFFALLITAMILLGSIPAGATDDPYSDPDSPSAYSDDDSSDTATDGDNDATAADDDATTADDDATTADDDDVTTTDDDNVTTADGEDVTTADGEEATTADGEEGAEDDQDTALTDPDAVDSTEAAEAPVNGSGAPKATPKKRSVKLAKTGAKDEVGKETTDKYEITYTKTASVKTSSTAYSFKGLSKISIRVKDVPEGKAQWVRAIVYDPNNATPAESITYKSDDWPLPDYVERVIGSDNSVTLNIDIGKADESLHFVKDGSKVYSLQFTTAEDTEGGLISHGRSFFLDEEGPEIEVKNFDSDQWRTSGFYFGLYVDDNTGIGQDDDGKELVTASEGTVDEWDDSTFNYMVTLDQRATDDTVTVTAEDELGNQTTKNVTVKVDSNAPVLELIEAPTAWSNDINNEQTFVVKATDPEGTDTTGSGVDTTTFKVDGISVPATALTGDDHKDEYQIKVSCDGQLTVDDNAGQTSDILELTRNIDQVAPTADDVSVRFFVESEEVARLYALLEDVLHIHVDSLYGHDENLKMRVTVADGGGAPITAINASHSGGTAFEVYGSADIQKSDDTHYYKEFILPTTTDEDAVKFYSSISFSITDAASNTGVIAMEDIEALYADSNADTKIGPGLANIVNTKIKPEVEITGKEKVVEDGTTQYAKSGSEYSFRTTDGVGHILSVKAYFDADSKFADGKPNGAAAVTVTGLDANFTYADGTYTYNLVTGGAENPLIDTAEWTYQIPAGLTSGKYVFYAEVTSCARNTGTIYQEIYVDNDAPNVSLAYTYVNNEGNTVPYNGSKWINTPVTVTLTVDDISAAYTKEMSGLNLPDNPENTVLAVKDGVNTVALTYGGVQTTADGKVYTYSFTVSTYAAAEKYQVIASDRLSNTNDTVKSSVIRVDQVTPTITNVKFAKKGEISGTGTVIQVLRLLSFGLYSNETVEVQVTANDSAPSSGFKTFAVNTDKDITVNGKKTESLANDLTESAILKINPQTLIKNDKNVTFTVTDVAGNAVTKTMEELRGDNLVEALGEKLNTVVFENGFEFMTTKAIKPTVTHAIDTTRDGFYKETVDGGEDKLWFSEKYNGAATTVKTTFDFEEDTTHLHGANVTLNGTDYTPDAVSTYGDAVKYNNQIQYNEIPEKEDQKVDTDTVVFEPQLTGAYAFKKTSDKSDGKNDVAITVEANSGNKTTDTATFYIDDTAPVITGVAFAGNGRTDYPTRVDENGNYLTRLSGSATGTYGYYFKNQTTMTVTATDYLTSKNEAISGCGIRRIYAFLDPTDTTNSNQQGQLVPVTQSEPVDGKVTATFTIKANFKGNIYVYAFDNVNNRSNNYYPDGTIAENEKLHKKNGISDATITINTAPYAKDNKNQDLFNSNVKVNLSVKDTFSGLYSLKYKISSPWTDSDLGSGYVEIGHSANSVSGWKIVKKDANLITEVSKDITLKAFSTHNYNDISIELEAYDRSGHKITAKKQTISIDTTAPKIELTPVDATHNHYDGDGKDYYQDTRTFNITVTERNFDPDAFVKAAVITAREGTAPSIVGVSDWSKDYTDFGTNSTHTATISFADEGDYTVELNYTDQANNKADAVKSDDFVIDKTDPVLSVTFDNNNPKNGNYYGTARVATVTVTEHNFAEGDGYITYSLTAHGADNASAKSTPQLALSGWGGSGDVHSTTLDFNEDGNYSFVITYQDKAARKATDHTESLFYIDLQIDKDGIVFTNVANNKAFGIEDVIPGVEFTDNNLNAAASKTKLTRISYDPKTGAKQETPTDLTFETATATTTKSEKYNNFPDKEANDGIYLYEATIEDMAGHTESKKVMFSVNRYGATYMCDDEATKQLLESGFTNDASDIRIIEINVTGIDDFSVTNTLDTDIADLENSKEGDTGFTRETLGGGDNSWYKYEYVIKKGNFTEEGDYTVTLNSTIKYSNEDLNTQMTNSTTRVENRSFPISFVVDKTAPVITIDGVAADKAYSEAERDVKIVCIDNNLDANTLKVLLNGEDAATSKDVDYKVNVKDGEIDVDLKITNDEQEEKYDLEVKVGDYAKNVAENNETKNFILSATWLTMYLRNTLALILTGVGIAVVIAAVVLLILKKRKKTPGA